MARHRFRFLTFLLTGSLCCFAGVTVGAAAQEVIAILPSAATVAAADLDGDGDQDVVAGSLSGDPTPFPRIVWFESDGAARPSFQMRSISPDPFATEGVHAADLDSDGDQDILATRLTGAGQADLVWFENAGGSPPTFLSHTLLAGPSATVGGCDISTADVDGDGDLDPLLMAGSSISWLENLGGTPLSFTPHTVSSIRAWDGSLGAADLDGDGDLDLVAGWYFVDALIDPIFSDGHVEWYENNGASPPAFLLHVVDPSVSFAVTAARAADLDADGFMDIVATRGSDTIAWYQNDGAAVPAFSKHVVTEDPDGFGQRVGVVHGPRDIVVGDLDGDSAADLVAASNGDNRITIFVNRGDATSFQRRLLTSKVEYPLQLALTDLNGDGHLDVISASIDDGKVAWYPTR